MNLNMTNETADQIETATIKLEGVAALLRLVQAGFFPETESTPSPEIVCSGLESLACQVENICEELRKICEGKSK